MQPLTVFVFFVTSGVNQTLKRKSGNKVTPNMSLLKSMQTQDSQQQARMDRNRRRTFKNYQEKKNWARMSPTARWVTQICESQIHQNVEAAFNNYLVLSDGGHEILMLRKPPDGKEYFCELCTSERTCSACSYFSPIVKFRRLRRLTFTEHCSASGRHIGYEVQCSCPYYGMFGIPCRHFCVLMQPRYHHVNVKWSLHYNLFWRRSGFSHRMPRFRARQYSTKLIVTVHEHQSMMAAADEKPAPRHMFNVPFCTPIQKNKKGMLISGNGAQESQFTQPAPAECDHNIGGLVQEVGIPEAAEEEAGAFCMSMPDADIGEIMKAKVGEMTVALRRNPMAMEALFSLISRTHEAVLSTSAANLSPENLANLVSFPESDKRRRGTRGISAGEPDRKKMKHRILVPM